MLEPFKIVQFEDSLDEEESENCDENFEVELKNDDGCEALHKVPDNEKDKARTQEETQEEAQEETQEEKSKKMSEEIIDKAWQDSKKIIEDANLEAINILKEAEKKAKEIKDEAKIQGYKEGKKEYYDIKNKAKEQLEKNKEEYKKIMIKSKNDIVKLSLAIAKKVVSQEVATSPNVIVSLAKDALKRTFQKEGVVIKVSPEDSDSLNKNLSKIAETDLGKTDVKVQESTVLKKGDLLVQTDFGVVDGSASKKISNLEKSFEVTEGDEKADGNL